jgi:hypothetical protein
MPSRPSAWPAARACARWRQYFRGVDHHRYGFGRGDPRCHFLNYFGHVIKEMGARMEDFALEFLNVAERDIEA